MELLFAKAQREQLVQAKLVQVTFHVSTFNDPRAYSGEAASVAGGLNSRPELSWGADQLSVRRVQTSSADCSRFSAIVAAAAFHLSSESPRSLRPQLSITARIHRKACSRRVPAEEAKRKRSAQLKENPPKEAET
jgi:hypothetical protein